MGPAALRTAGLAAAIAAQNWDVVDLGDATPARGGPLFHANPALKNLTETIRWIDGLSAAARRIPQGVTPVFLGGGHSMAAATVPAMAERAQQAGKALYVLWLDAHPDINTLHTTTSGALHGVPTAYFTGLDPCAPFPAPPAIVAPENILMMGLRSVDPPERALLAAAGIDAMDMRRIDEEGVARPLARFLDRVRAEDAHLHVSLDVDFLDPAIAPAVGTTVPGGATFREAHLIMEMLHDSGRVTSLDLVELNPFLDVRGATAILMTDLAASLFGRRILDRPTGSFR